MPPTCFLANSKYDNSWHFFFFEDFLRTFPSSHNYVLLYVDLSHKIPLKYIEVWSDNLAKREKAQLEDSTQTEEFRDLDALPLSDDGMKEVHY